MARKYRGTKTLFEGHEPDPRLLFQNRLRWIREPGPLGLDLGDLIDSTLITGFPYAVELYHPNREGWKNWGENVALPEAKLDQWFQCRQKQLARRRLLPSTCPLRTCQANAIDLALIVDTTGSMGGYIQQVKTDLNAILDTLQSTTSSFRVAVIDYRDFPERTGSSTDYPARIVLDFSNEPSSITAAIDSLAADGGGDGPETVYSAMHAAFTSLMWRDGVVKSALVLGDAPPLMGSDGAEPISGLTPSQIIDESLALDPVQVIALDMGQLASPDLQNIIDRTHGRTYSNIADLTATIREIINTTSKLPFAWFDNGFVGKIGIPVTFSADGSYDPENLPITLYEWDFNGDGVFDFTSDNYTASHTYSEAFDGTVVLRVTSGGGSSLASAHIVINTQGVAPQGGGAPCEIDLDGFSIFFDNETGQVLDCIADNPRPWPDIFNHSLNTTECGALVEKDCPLIETSYYEDRWWCAVATVYGKCSPLNNNDEYTDQVLQNQGLPKVCFTADGTPKAARCKDISLPLVNGRASLVPSAIDDGSSEECGFSFESKINKTDFTCLDLGRNNVVSLTLVSPADQSKTVSCNSLVSVSDSDGYCSSGTCLKLNAPCIYNTEKDVCCDDEQLVCRSSSEKKKKKEVGNKGQCQKCLTLDSLCSQTTECCPGYKCSSKKRRALRGMKKIPEGNNKNKKYCIPSN